MFVERHKLEGLELRRGEQVGVGLPRQLDIQDLAHGRSEDVAVPLETEELIPAAGLVAALKVSSRAAIAAALGHLNPTRIQPV